LKFGWTPWLRADRWRFDSRHQVSSLGQLCLQELPAKVKIGVRLVGAGKRTHGANIAGGPVGWVAISLLRCQLRLARGSNTRKRLRLLQAASSPETYLAAHDMSAQEKLFETGEQARSDTLRAMMIRQQNRRVLLPFGQRWPRSFGQFFRFLSGTLGGHAANVIAGSIAK
jgi:hypothetical protein